MKQILAYILSPIATLLLILLLIIFHPLQVIARNLFGYTAHKKTVVLLNYFILKSLLVLGVRMRFSGFERIPPDRPLIIVSNHQSAYDVPPVIWGFRKFHPKFVAKMELGNYIPSISYNLKHGGSVIIDRSNRQGSIKEIFRLGKFIEEHNYAACIFPEGTRSKDGKIGTFQPGGIKTLYKAAPSAILVPFVIDGHDRIQPRGFFPMGLGVRVQYTVLDPVDPANQTIDDAVKKIEEQIRSFY